MAAPMALQQVHPNMQMVAYPQQGYAPPPQQETMGYKNINPNNMQFGGVQLSDGSNASRLLHHAVADPEGVKCMNRMMCVFSESADNVLINNRYVQVWDNKIIISEPGVVPFVLGFCNKTWYDNFQTISLDDTVMAEALDAKCCSPCGMPPKYNWSPTNALVCCGWTGQALLLKEKDPPCCACSGGECWAFKCCEIAKVTPAWFGRRYVYGLKDTAPLIAAIEQAKAARGIQFQWQSMYQRMHK